MRLVDIFHPSCIHLARHLLRGSVLTLLTGGITASILDEQASGDEKVVTVEVRNTASRDVILDKVIVPTTSDPPERPDQ